MSHPVWKFFTVVQRQMGGNNVEYSVCQVAGCAVGTGAQRRAYETKGKFSTNLALHIHNDHNRHQKESDELTEALKTWQVPLSIVLDIWSQRGLGRSFMSVTVVTRM